MSILYTCSPVALEILTMQCSADVALVGCRMTDKPEYILTVDVLKFLTNPLNDGALLAILESKLSMRAGIGDSVISQLKRIVRDSNHPIPVWNCLKDLAQRRDTSTRKRNAVNRMIDWHRRCGTSPHASNMNRTHRFCSLVFERWRACCRVYGRVMFMALPDALLEIWKESGISTLVLKNRKKSATGKTSENPDNSSVSGASSRPDMASNRQLSASMSQYSGMSVADVRCTPLSKRKAPDSPAADIKSNILTSPTLEALHNNSKEFLAEWKGDSLFLERFGELQLASSSSAQAGQPQSLLSLATAAVLHLPLTRRVHAVNMLATHNPGLADLILSVNKCGYGPVADFVQHLDLYSSDVAEEEGSQAQVIDGKVTLSTVHGCKGATFSPHELAPLVLGFELADCAGLEWPVVFVPKFIESVMPLVFFHKTAIPVDGDEDAGCEDMAIAAVQADARVRGKLLKTHDDVVAYLPEWMRQDGLDPDGELEMGSDSSVGLGADLHMDSERVSKCYKRKKEKQHDEVCLAICIMSPLHYLAWYRWFRVVPSIYADWGLKGFTAGGDAAGARCIYTCKRSFVCV